MAMNSYKSFLMYSEDGENYTKLTDVKSIPATGDEPEQLETTTLSDPQRTYTEGLQDNPNKTFTANYDPATYAALLALAHRSLYFAIWLGGIDNPGQKATPTGDQGKFHFTGTLTVWYNGGEVNSVQEMTICIVPSSPVGFKTSVSVTLDKHSATLNDGDTLTLVAAKNPSTATVVWSTNNSSVATVSNGTVTAEGVGTAVIVATATSEGESDVDTCVITVKA